MTLARRLLGARGSGVFQPSVFTVTGPYDPGFDHTTTVLTQLHCHTTGSTDGSISPTAMVAGYLAAGYEALMLTDHDAVTAQPAGITTAITGVELSPSTNHIIAIDSSYSRGAETDAQTIIDGVVAGGGQAQIAHPMWSVGMTYAEMAALTDYLGLEIHNGLVVSGAGGADPVANPGYALARWDALLVGSRRDIWGFSVDDLHATGAYSTYDLGRVQVFTATNTPANVVASVVSGNFAADIANHGVTPGFPARTPSGLYVACPGAVRVEAWGNDGFLDATDGDSHAHTFDGTQSYVRLVAIGDYTEPFSASLSDRWAAVDGTWTVAGGTLGLSSDATARRIILRRHRQGDFGASLDMKLGSGALSGVALMFNVLDGTRYYMLRLGESANADWNNQLAVGYTTDGAFAGVPLDSYAITATEGTWYRIVMDYTASTGRIRAKVWDRDAGSDPGTWQIDITDTSWPHGAFGLRANFAAEIDNLYLSGFQTFYQPVSID